MGGVEGGRGNGLRRSHPHLRAGERQDELHVECGAGARVEVRGQGYGSAGVDEFAGRGILLQAQVEIGSG